MQVTDQSVAVIKNLLRNGKYSYPLHRYSASYLNVVSLLMSATSNLDDNDQAQLQLKSFKLLSEVRLIFESNRIENAGASMSETKKLINEYFPEIPNDYASFYAIDPKMVHEILSGKRAKDFLSKIKELGISLEKARPTVQFGKQSREFIEVAQHYLGYLNTENAKLRFVYNYVANVEAREIKKKPSIKRKKEWKERFSKLDFDAISQPLPFSEEWIKFLHATISNNLLPKDAGVKPGEYRIDDRAAGIDTVFVSPKLVPQAMKVFVENSNKLIIDLLESKDYSKLHPITVAAKISHQIVRIHPFPDFNGRLSRLIASYVLSLFGVPFAVTLRGAPRDKQRYISALKRADVGNITHYESILAKSVIDCFLEIDSNLAASGVATFKERALQPVTDVV